MKNLNTIFKKPLTWIICGFVAIIGLSVFMVLQCTRPPASSAWFDGQGENDAYEFPITPKKTPEKWKTFQSHQEMIDAIQIPGHQLKDMSTEGVIESCINYPLYGNMMLHDSFLMGFRIQLNNFNGLQELYKREDSATKLIKIFESINLKKLKKTENSSLRYRYICFMIAQDEIISQLSHEQKMKLLSTITSQNKEIIEKHSDVFSQHSPIFIKFNLYRTLYSEFNELYYSNACIYQFINTGMWMGISNEEFEELMNQINEIVGDK
ncbi:MAG: hypothetical protein PHV32_04305 [Eubacteriales bacterium]|nr:hypothetical protein [Oscillospiraceae bacterium]MDD4493559.1 hypothetical protein [Eubacteriales bacterium]